MTTDIASIASITSVAGERVTLLRPATFEGVELARVENTYRPWHGITDEFVISIATDIADNPCHSVYRKQKYEGGFLRVLSPGEAYRMVPQGRCDWLLLRLRPAAFADYAPTPLGRKGSLRSHLFEDRPTYEAFRAIHLAFASNGSVDACTSLLRNAVELLVRKDEDAEEPPRSFIAPRAVRTARELIHVRLTEDLTLSELAEAAGLSREHLLRSFHKELGMPPHQYLMHARVARARALLAEGAPATQVAHDAGFCDQSHLNRWFKKVLGVTPGQYARARTSNPYERAVA